MSQRKVQEGFFKSFDGTELFYRAWDPARPSERADKRALIVIHRGHEHSGRLHDLIQGLGLDDYPAFGFDCRGHGKSPGPRGYAPDFGHHVKDLDTFVRFVSDKFGIAIENMAVVANSVGAVITSTWVHDYAPQIRCMVLAAPAFHVKLYVPLALPGLRVLDKIRHPAFISSYVKSKFLTHDPVQAKLYDEDKLITPQIAVNILVDLFDTSNRVIEDAAAIVTPTLVLSAGSDWVVHVGPQKRFFDRLSSPVKEFETYPGFYHGILYEKERHLPLKRASEFVSRCFEQNLRPVSLLNAHRQGYTRAEYELLLNGQPSLLERLNFSMQRLGMSTLGMLSEGIKVGYRNGFDSGLSLDHVYKNRATGVSPIGRLLDYFYINAIGWRGIRQRKVHLQEAFDKAVDELAGRGEKIRIMDIAAGGGRYLLDTAKALEARGVKDVEILIRDHDIRNINEAKLEAERMGLKTVRFKLADAFDPASYDVKEFAPNILVISGLYELFPDNDLVLRSLRGAASVVADGGYVIYTGQPWHPQLKMIAHTLPNRENARWVMRRRTQAELDEMFRSVGVSKTDMRIDRWGIFTVSVGRLRKAGS